MFFFAANGCPAGTFKCGSGAQRCTSSVCDGIWDCEDGSDETLVACQSLGLGRQFGKLIIANYDHPLMLLSEPNDIVVFIPKIVLPIMCSDAMMGKVVSMMNMRMIVPIWQNIAGMVPIRTTAMVSEVIGYSGNPDSTWYHPQLPRWLIHNYDVRVFV